MEDMRRITTNPMIIDAGDASPIKALPYRVPMHLVKYLKKELDDLKRQVIIVEHPTVVSTHLMVKKKDAQWRLVMDYRQLNSVVKKDASCLPIAQD